MLLEYGLILTTLEVLPSEIVILVSCIAKFDDSIYKTPSVLFTLGLELLQVSAALVIVVPAVGMYDVAYDCCSNCAPNIRKEAATAEPLFWAITKEPLVSGETIEPVILTHSLVGVKFVTWPLTIKLCCTWVVPSDLTYNDGA